MKTHALMLVSAILPCLASVAPAHADEEFDTLIDDYNQARLAWRAELRQTEAANPSKPPPSPAETFLPRFKAYAEQRAGTSDAIPALIWIIDDAGRYLPADQRERVGKWAVERLTRDHAADPTLKNHLSKLRYAQYGIGKQPLIDLYERVAEVNQDKTAAAWATFNLAFTLYLDTTPTLPGQKTATGEDQALKLFRQTIKDYPDTRAAELAAGYIYEAEHLQIGMVAPEIVGTDVDGQQIRLSQFRGQVVVLDFWGFW